MTEEQITELVARAEAGDKAAEEALLAASAQVLAEMAGVEDN